MSRSLKRSFFPAFFLFFFTSVFYSQDNQIQTQLKVKQLIEKKAEYHKLTEGKQYGYRIKIHFGTDREQAKAVRADFMTHFNDYPTYEEYQLPYFVVLVGDYKTKREAFEFLQKIKLQFRNAFIVKGKINVIE